MRLYNLSLHPQVRMLGKVSSAWLALSLSLAAAHGQTAAKCPTTAALTLTEVVVLIDKNPEGRTLQRLSICQVGFQLDFAAIDRLMKVRTSSAIMDALNQATAAKLTAEQAHAQVAELERHIAGLDKSVSDLPFRSRVLFLEQSSFVTPVPLVYGKYDADANQLTATVGTEAYRFDKVPAKTAETLFNNWKQVKVNRPYIDDDSHTRTLTFTSLSQSGLPQQMLEVADKAKREHAASDYLAEADRRMAKGDYDGALEQFKLAQAADKTNQAAAKGIDAATTRGHFLIVEEKRQLAAREWVDHRTSLMWTMDDNGQDIDRKGSVQYCQALRSGGMTDWRLPSADELKFLYEPSHKRTTFPTRTSTSFIENGKVTSLPAGTYWPYFITGNIVLTNPHLWSGTDFGQGFAQEFAFDTGKADHDSVNTKMFMRAVCVRTYVLPTDAEIASTSTQDSEVPSSPAGVWTDVATKLTWTLKDNGADIDWTRAGSYCKSLQTGGYSDWRLPSPDELLAILDPRSSSFTTPSTGEVTASLNGAARQYARGASYPYHIKGGIVLTTANVWSSYKGKPSPNNEAVMASFQDGRLWQRANDPTFQRALCVRP